MKKNLQELAITLNLSPLQIVALNGIGQDIKDGKDGLASYDMLTDGEDCYLRAWLTNEGVAIA